MKYKNWHDTSVWIVWLRGKLTTEYNTVSAHKLKPGVMSAKIRNFRWYRSLMQMQTIISM